MKRLAIAALALAGCLSVPPPGSLDDDGGPPPDARAAPDASPGGEVVLVEDDFARDETGGWGVASVGVMWNLSDPSRASVEGGKGHLVLPDTVAPDPLGAVQPLDEVEPTVEYLATVELSGLPTTAPIDILLAVQASTDVDSGYAAMLRYTADGFVELGLVRNDGSLSFIGDDPVTLSLSNALATIRVRFTADLAAETLRARAWEPADGEPDWEMVATEANLIPSVGALAIITVPSDGEVDQPYISVDDVLAVRPAAN